MNSLKERNKVLLHQYPYGHDGVNLDFLVYDDVPVYELLGGLAGKFAQHEGEVAQAGATLGQACRHEVKVALACPA